MEEKSRKNITYLLILAVLLASAVISISKGNIEFLYYSGCIFLISLAIKIIDSKHPISSRSLIGFLAIVILHMLGGNLQIQGQRLYDLWIIPQIFKYDNFMHILAIYVLTIITYYLISPYINNKLRNNKLVYSIILILIVSGVGAMNEILELSVVILFNAQQNIGDYMNNALDLVYNVVGSALACIYLMNKPRK